jgi:hypothetical protein
MCISVLAAIAFSYATLDHPVVYSIRVNLAGALPLMSGDDKRAEVSMSFRTQASGSGAKRGIKFQLATFSLGLHDSGTNSFQPLPVDLGAAREYFPETTVESSALGELGNVTPKAKRSPFRLPGIDTESLPALTFLALQFPEGGIEQGKPWSYTRQLLGDKTNYTATYNGSEKAGERFDLKLIQEGEVAKVEGQGSVWFDAPVGKIIKGELKATVTTGTADKPKIVKMTVSLEAKQE